MPTPLIVIGICVLFILLLLSLRVRITILYRDGAELTVRLLFLKFRIYPHDKPVKWKNYSPKKAARIAARKAKRAEKKAARKAKKAAKKQTDKELQAAGKKEKVTFAEKLVSVRALAAALIRKTHRHLRLKAARIHIKVATGDAASTAVLYGVVCQSLAYLLALLDRVTKLKASPTDVSVTADYLADWPSADIKLQFSIRVWGVLAVAIASVFSYMNAKRTQRAEKERLKKRKEKRLAARAAARNAQKGNRHG
ncbi:MAG: DUF2953 domain-containing protein [Clostridia bacterium]|nr:DUF2953 domain-containing protein [Clostridia bacterium]